MFGEEKGDGRDDIDKCAAEVLDGKAEGVDVEFGEDDKSNAGIYSLMEKCC
jgi:hypothetical protein